MRLVVDANVLVAAFMKESLTRELLMDDRFKLVTPEYGLQETYEVLKRPAVRKRLGVEPAIFEDLWKTLTQGIEVFPKSVYEPRLKQCLGIAPHAEDAPYLALAMCLKVAVWSNDSGLQGQSIVPVHTTKKLISLL